MARKKAGPVPAELQRYSRALNKTRLAAIMGVAGMAFVAVASYFLGPQWVKIALAVFLVGIVSSLLSVGGTYVGNCPHCGTKTPYVHALGVYIVKCTRCGKPIKVNKTKEGFFFRRP